jgi:hypothetical protein
MYSTDHTARREMGEKTFTTTDARTVGEQLGIDWTSCPFDIEQFRAGMDVELEHGTRDPDTDVTGDDPLLTGKIALAHCGSYPTTTRASLGWRPKAKPHLGRASRATASARRVGRESR